MNRRRLQLGILVLVMAAASAARATPAAGQKTALQWKYEPGSEFVYRMTNEQKMEMAAMGSSTSEQVQTMRWRVEDVAPSGDATISVTTERVQIEMRGMAGNVSFDSQNGEPPDQPQIGVLAAMVGSNYTVVISPSGEVRSVRGMDELRRRVVDAMPPGQADAALAMTDQMFSDDAMIGMMQQGFQFFPEEPVGPGESWSSSFTIPLPMLGTMNTNMTYSLVGLEERDQHTIAAIGVSGDVSFRRDESSPPVTVEITDARVTGTIQFDTDLGMTLSSDMTTTMQMSMDAGGQQMTMGTEQRTKMELIEQVRGG